MEHARNWCDVTYKIEIEFVIERGVDRVLRAGNEESVPIGRSPHDRLGGDVLALSPTDFGQLIADDTEKWGKVIKTANIKPE